MVSGDSVFLAGAWRKTPGTYIDNFTTINGCDSIVTTTVIVTFTTTITGATALCQSQAVNISYTATLHPGSSYNWSVNGGNITGSSGINQVTVTWNVNGNNTITVIECNSNLSFCDTAVLTVVVAGGIPVISTISICTGDSVFINNAWQTAAGTFYDTIPGSGACDTILITNLGVYPNYADTTQLVINSGDSAFLAGVWQQTTGVYVDNFISSAGCDSIIVTYLLVIVGLEETSEEQFELWPNPASDGFYLKNLSTQTGMISVFDQNGRLLLRQMSTTGIVYLDVRMFAVGMYYLQMEANEKRYFRRLEIVR
ncbi:MAG: T9SS type A sorting domain-containing protein [Bacteroidetes bacterium]|nr:T9SS type A sorting domain-containing protein [Bacteroidota bacterium]